MSERIVPLRRSVLWLFVMSLLMTMCASPALAWEGVVVRVQDGDTVLVAPEGTEHGDIMVRLYGIDAPELNQPGGTISRDILQQNAQPGETVKVVPLNEDRYNRVIGLLIHAGVTLNYKQLQEGQAWVYTQYCKARFCREWQRAEQSAQESQIGLWQEASPTPPWEWRKR